jgi:hypothetical protein
VTLAPASSNPFPGLRPFNEHDAHRFFGREQDLEAMRTRLSRERTLTVIGLSGTGKSSLVRAGLLPLLRAGTSQRERWRIGVMRPGSAPVDQLAQSLESALDGQFDGQPAPDTFAIRAATLRRGSLGLIEAIAEARLSPDDRVLIVVDQLEELFRFAFSREDGADQARAFAQLLLEAVLQRDLPIYVVLTIRSDFVGECAGVPGLAQLVNQSPYLVPHLTRHGLRRIVERPLEAYGQIITHRLVNRILLEVGDDPLRLPALQHVLMRTWEAWSANGGVGPIDMDAYDSAGGLDHALALHADAACASLDQGGQRIAEIVLSALTDRIDGRLVRRPEQLRHLAELCGTAVADVARVVDVFRSPSANFLTPPPAIALSGDSVIDITHESLIRSWPRMSHWIEMEEQRASRYRRLMSDAQMWRQDAASLLRNPELAMARQLMSERIVSPAWARRYGGSYDIACEYLAASEDEDQAERARENEARTREAEAVRYWKRRATLALAALALVVATILVMLLLN